MPIVDAVILAGGAPAAADPLFALTGGRPKALLPLAGRPMVDWVLQAVGRAASVRRVALAGLAEPGGLECPKPWACLPDHGGLIENLLAAARWAQADAQPPSHLLAVTGDIPLVEPAMLDWFVRAGLEAGQDVVYSLVPQAAMEGRFPGSRRTYFRLREGRFTAGDIVLVRAGVLAGRQPLWDRLLAARKSLVRQAALVGLDTFLLAAAGRLSIPFGQRLIRERLGVDGRLLINPHPEVGMDVDKPRQYELARRELEARP